jgi:hypothetical protein
LAGGLVATRSHAVCPSGLANISRVS